MIHSYLAQKSPEIIKHLSSWLKTSLIDVFLLLQLLRTVPVWAHRFLISLHYVLESVPVQGLTVQEHREEREALGPDPWLQYYFICFSSVSNSCLYSVPVPRTLLTFFFLLNRHWNKTNNFFRFLVSGLRSQKLGPLSWKNTMCIFD